MLINRETPKTKLENIMTLAKEIYERKINSNPDKVFFDDMIGLRQIEIHTDNFHGTICKYERENYYAIRVYVNGYYFGVSENSKGDVNYYILSEVDFYLSYISYDGSYTVEDCNEEIINICIDKIYEDLKRFNRI